MHAAKLVAMWTARVVGTAFILLAVYLWLFTPSSDCDPFKLFGCGLLDLGITGVLGTVLRWFLICLVATPGLMLWHWKPFKGQPQQGSEVTPPS